LAVGVGAVELAHGVASVAGVFVGDECCALGAVGAVVEEAGGEDWANAVEELLGWMLGQGFAVLDCECAYGNVVFRELVVKVVYTDLASVAVDMLAMVGFLRSLYTVLLVGCAPGRRSPVVRLVVFIATAATAYAVFFVAIVYPVAGSKSAAVQCNNHIQ